MHSYLKTIGFRSCQDKNQIRQLLKLVMEKPDSMHLVQTDAHSTLAVLTREISEGIGIALYGELDENGQFQMEYYYPYMTGRRISSVNDTVIQKQGSRDSYAGMYEDYRVGMTLIYFLTNVFQMKEIYSRTGKEPRVMATRLAGLASDGKILLPVRKSKEEMEQARVLSKRREKLIEAAKQGSEEALENLTVEEMNTFAKVNRRLEKEDLYSIVDSFFIPNGVECDQYSVMGDIMECETVENRLTGEKMVRMSLLCNDITMEVLIHREDLLGMPEAGFRFKGNIWLQGSAEFRVNS